MTKLKIYFDVLPDAQKDVWKLLSPVSKMGFVLYGGTAVALHLGHRHSVDFDFFSSQNFEEQTLTKLLPFLNQKPPAEPVVCPDLWSRSKRLDIAATSERALTLKAPK